jgi:hypothetical protein
MPDRVLLDRISLRERERGLVIGGTGSGKSTLSDHLGIDWDHRYRARGGRRLILDSKPRYRAEWTARGRAAAPRYKGWSHGQPVPGSVVCDTPEDLDLVWKLGYRVAIVQRQDDEPEAVAIARMIATARRFLSQARASRPQLLHVDETLDFFHSNGAPRGGDDVIARIARAGRERGCALLAGSQRTRGIPATLMSELSKLYRFRLDYVADAKRFGEMGAPDMSNPTRPHVFLYWTKDDYARAWGPYRLNI